MIASRSYRLALILFGLCLSLLHALPPARGDAMQPWSGASATAGPDTHSGATASASNQFSQKVEYSIPSSPTRGGYFDYAGGDSSATAGGSAAALLQVNTEGRVGNPGTTNVAVGIRDPATASSRWTNDTVTITPPAGSPIPDSIRLQFSLTFNPPDAYRRPVDFNYGTVKVQANDKTIYIGVDGGGGNSYDPKDFDKVTKNPYNPDPTVGTFHLDLPVNKSGVSAPFSLSLAAATAIFTDSNTSLDSFHRDVLGLTGVTFTDGTSLTAKGYGVSFASGLLSSPQPVPEPTSVALWSVVALAGAWIARQRSRC